jgi:hypothetical protein
VKVAPEMKHGENFLFSISGVTCAFCLAVSSNYSVSIKYINKREIKAILSAISKQFMNSSSHFYVNYVQHHLEKKDYLNAISKQFMKI